MNKIIIGCDPDSNKSGIAMYHCGELKYLECMPLVAIYRMFAQRDTDRVAFGYECELHIEDLHSNKGFWHKGGSGAARKVGRCEQVQVEIERMAEHFGIKVVRHKVSKKWKDQAGKKEFERNTGWTGRSNEDTRSAAWFGFIGSRGNS